MKQRDKMRELFRLHKGNTVKIISAYVEAERRGEVRRKSNAHGITREAYARALFDDGVRKRWIYDAPS